MATLRQEKSLISRSVYGLAWHSAEISAFFVTPILREIRVDELCHFKHLEALNCDFYEFLHLLKTEMYQKQQKRQF